MPFRALATVFALVAAATLSASAVARTRGGGNVLTVSMCGDHRKVVRIPIKGDRNGQGDCPSACHALCGRERDGTCCDEE